MSISTVESEAGATVITAELIEVLRAQFTLDWDGIHGIAHWERVRENGLRLAEQTGANRTVVELFAYLHDCRRFNNEHDPEHGPRAAQFAIQLRDRYFSLTDAEFKLLQKACNGHTRGQTLADITVQTCWDADRLDLGRIGTRPDPSRLCTAAARQPQILEWAWQRSQAYS